MPHENALLLHVKAKHHLHTCKQCGGTFRGDYEEHLTTVQHRQHRKRVRQELSTNDVLQPDLPKTPDIAAPISPEIPINENNNDDDYTEQTKQTKPEKEKPIVTLLKKHSIPFRELVEETRKQLDEAQFKKYVNIQSIILCTY